MTGSPLLRLALILIALVALAIPLASITGRTEAPPSQTDVTEPARPFTRTVTFAITSTSTPASLTITATDRTLATDPPATFTAELPATATDLIIRASWPDTTSHALRVIATNDGLPLIDQTFWATDTLADVLTLPGTEP